MITGLFDKNGSPINIGDRTRLILESGEVREFDVQFKTVKRVVRCHPDFDTKYAEVNITGIVFSWNGYDLFPCVDADGISDVEEHCRGGVGDLIRRGGEIYKNQTFADVLGDEDIKEPYEIASTEW